MVEETSMLDINFSDRNVSPDFKDSLCDTYHVEGGDAPEEMQGFRHRQRKVTRQARRFSLHR